MNYENEKIIDCNVFESVLTDYIDGGLDKETHKAVAAHALRCPLCHSLLNEVRDALTLCREMSAPKHPLAQMEARVFSLTTPDAAMSCTQFEEHLTDYLDGFLPAVVFHRWERHAALCHNCTDLPGEVVRSIAACYTYKTDELPVPSMLNAKILRATIGTTEARTIKASWTSQMSEWMRGWTFPISIPQLTPVAMMLLVAALFFSQTASADSSFAGVYQKSFELAELTYKQSAEVVLGGERAPAVVSPKSNQQPIDGTYVNEGK